MVLKEHHGRSGLMTCRAHTGSVHAVHPDSLKFSYVLGAVPGENRSVAFQMRALPFGSVRSIHAFPRVAHSLWAITSEFLVPWTNLLR